VKHRIVIYLGLATLGLTAAAPAKADPIRTAQAQLPPYEILTIVRSTGLDPLSRPVRRGSTYVLRAIDGYGEEVRVIVGAQRGEILSVQPVMPASAPYETPGPVYGPGPRYVDPHYADPRYEPGPRYLPEPNYEPESDARYQPWQPDPRGPRVIYAPRAATAPIDQAPAAKATPSAKKPAPAPKSAVVTPAKPPAPPARPTDASAPAKPASESQAASAATKNATPEAGKTAPAAASTSAIPPVQTFE